MTLRELDNAIAGFSLKEQEDYQWDLYNARLIAYYACAPHLGKNAKVKKPEDLFPIDLDKRLKKSKVKKLKPIQRVERDQ